MEIQWKYNNNKQYYRNLLKGGTLDVKATIESTNEYIASMLNEGYEFKESKDLRKYIIGNSDNSSSIEIIYNEFGDIENKVSDLRIFKSNIIFADLSNKRYKKIQIEFKNIIKKISLFMQDKKKHMNDMLKSDIEEYKFEEKPEYISYLYSNAIYGDGDMKDIRTSIIHLETIYNNLLQITTYMFRSKTLIIIPGDSGYRLMRVIQFMLEEYRDYFDFVYFSLSRVAENLENDSKGDNYKKYKNYVCSKIRCDIKYNNYIIYDYIASGTSVILIEKILLHTGVKRHLINIISVPDAVMHFGAESEHRCINSHDIIESRETYRKYTSYMCTFIIILLYNLLKDKLSHSAAGVRPQTEISEVEKSIIANMDYRQSLIFIRLEQARSQLAYLDPIVLPLRPPERLEIMD
jgi:hypothetical protein